MKIKVFSALLTLLLLLQMCSCAYDKSASEDKTGGRENGVQFRKDGGEPSSHDIADYSGRDFVVASSDADFVKPDSDVGIINEALYKRNKNLSEKYNVNISVIKAGTAEINTNLQAAYNAGTEYCNALYVPMKNISGIASQELLLNIYSIPFVKLEEEYMYPSRIKETSVRDTLYGLYSAAALDDRFMWCVYYNKDVYSSLGFENPYELVKNGDWTWEKFLSYSDSARADLDGNGRILRKTDRFGHAAAGNTLDFVNAVFASIGGKFFSFDENGFPYMDYYDFADSNMDLISRICSKSRSLYPAENPGNEAAEAFLDGRSLFFCDSLLYCSYFANMQDEYGILPMPKLSEEDDYKTYVDEDVCGFAFPNTNSDTGFLGNIINGLYSSSYDTLKDCVKKSWTRNYLRDNDSAVMFDYITKNPVYDLAYIHGTGMPEFANASYKILQSAVQGKVRLKSAYNQNSGPFYNFAKEEFING